MPWKQLSEILGLARGGAVRTALEDLWNGRGGEACHGSSGASGVAFTMAVVSLCAKMAKADGVAVPVEADAFERHFRVPPEEMRNVRRLFDLAKQDVAGFQAYAEQIARLLADAPKLLSDVLECLFQIAVADGVLTVDLPPLELIDGALRLGTPTAMSIPTANGEGFGDVLLPGDDVAVHWERVCGRLSPTQARTLTAVTRRNLDVANATI